MKTMPYIKKESDAKLILLEENKIRCVYLDLRSEWSLGRTCPGNNPDIRLSSAIAGRKHGEFLHSGENWYYSDGGSLNGTFLNEEKLTGNTRPVVLNDGDILRIDSQNLERPDGRGVWMMFTTGRVSENWQFYSLNRRTAMIGRDCVNCNVVVDVPYISKRHAAISFQKNSYYIEDCQSLSGTWLNNKRIIQKTRLKPKDRISICDYHFIFTGDSLVIDNHDGKVEFKEESGKNSGGTRSQMNPIILQADIQSKKVPDFNGRGKKELIRDVQITVKEGSLVALLGSSGAGKSTVMNCLNGMEVKGVEGEILFYGEDLIENFDRLKYLIGSVPQKAVLHPMLTVQEELKEAAILRLPNDITPQEINRYVDRTIHQLGLDSKRLTKIQKCSGGEQQRVNIGIELVADRKLLCLDEPDAGLDPGTKTELFTILRNLAHEQKKSILVIIHDVSEIDLFDQMIMMAKVNDVGRLAFSGSPEEGRNYFGTDIKNVYSLLAKNPEKFVRC